MNIKSFPKSKTAAAIVSAILCTNSVADSELLDSLSLEDILNLEVSVASSKALSIRESPGIISYISATEIKNSGARDLIDVLRLVPGFDFGADVLGTTGVAVRGNWAYEGKVLFLWDGQEMNELKFANTQLGNRFPVDTISRIEIIRGPGSAMYGGFAELGVVNIVSKNAEELGDGEASFMVGRMKDTTSRATATVSFGQIVEDKDLEFTASLYTGRGERSDVEFEDYFGSSYNMDEHQLDPFFLNLGLKWKGLTVRSIIDRYATRQQNGFFAHLEQSEDRTFSSHHFEIKYDFQISENFSLTPKFNTKKQWPWNVNHPNSPDGLERDNIQRNTYNVSGNWDITDAHNLAFGLEYYEDETGGYQADGPAATYEEDDTALFAQYMWFSDFGNITLGARYEDHSRAGDSFVPRFAWTKVWDKLHTKFLASKAFRTPTSAAFGFGDLVPEETTVLEIEAGYQFSNNFFITSNLFSIGIEDPIVFGDGTGYTNFDSVGTRGFELETKWIEDWGYLNLTYSFYTEKENNVDTYQIKDENGVIIKDDQLLGFSPHKLTLNASYKVNDAVSLNPTIIHHGEKYVVDAINNQFAGVASKSDAVTFVNFNVDFKFPSMEVKLGVHNLLNEKNVFSVPYNNGGKSLPGPSREIFAKISKAI